MNSYKQKLALMLLLLETQRSRRRARYSKRKNETKRNGEPPSKRLKRSESSSSSSSSSSEEDDDSSFDSETTFDIFSSDSNSDSEGSFADSSNSDHENGKSDSDHSELQDDISIKEEPLFDSDLDTIPEAEQNKSKRKRTTEEPPITNGNLEIKTEVLDGIVDAVEVDRNALLTNNEVQIKDEPADVPESKDDVVQIKEELETSDIVGSSSDITETSPKS